MNANQFHGTIRKIAGKVQEQAGHVMGNRRQVLRGLQRQVLGAAEQRLGDFQEAARRAGINNRVRGLHL